MFNRYWRDYPWFMQVMLFGLMVFTFTSFFLLVGGLAVAKITGYTVTQIIKINSGSSAALIRAAGLLQMISSIGVFLLPALFFAYQTHPHMDSYLGIRKPGKAIHWILAILLLLSAYPLFVALGELTTKIDLGTIANEKQSENDRISNAFLSMKGSLNFINTFVMIAILPAVGEELLFRGVVMRLSYQQSKKIGLSIVISALFFALMHGTPYSYIAIFIAGCLLGLIYYMTGSILCSIAAHLCYNGIQVCIAFFARDIEHFPAWVTIVCAIIFALMLLMLLKTKTPMGRNWADNFANEELDEIANSENNNQQ